jgi:hypothetical protein
MAFFDRFRDTRTHEDRLREEAGLTGLPAETTRTFGTRAIAIANETPGEIFDDTDDSDEEDDPEFEAEVKARVVEIEAMSISELLEDAADDTARAELGDEEDELFYLGHANATYNRAVALLLQQLINQNNSEPKTFDPSNIQDK